MARTASLTLRLNASIKAYPPQFGLLFAGMLVSTIGSSMVWPFLVFNFPNLLENRISEDLRIVVAFVPVDEENSVIYLRNNQRFVEVPLVRNLVDALQNFGLCLYPAPGQSDRIGADSEEI